MFKPLQGKEMRLLVTGGAGFIGANFCHYWRQRYHKSTLVVLDSLTYAGNLANLRPLEGSDGFRFVHGDINDTQLVEKLLKDEQLNVIVHFAAESHVDRSIHDPDAFLRTNILGTHSLLQAARKCWLEGSQGVIPHRFHHISTDEVYGTLGPQDPAFREDTPYAPNSPYAASKAASDHLVRAYQHTYGLSATTSNCSNNYGPFHFPEKLIPLVILNILHNRPLPIYGDGQQIRDWLFVEDHCQGISLILEKGKDGENYNIGGNNERSNLEIVRLICQLIDEAFDRDTDLSIRFPHAAPALGNRSESLITYVQDRPGHDRRYAIDASKIRRELGYKPLHSFSKGIRKTINWYLQNYDWWKPLLDDTYAEWIQKQYIQNLP
jgi:dTDP-glucose 4,6-dehydratase